MLLINVYVVAIIPIRTRGNTSLPGLGSSLKVSMIITPKMGFRNKSRAQLWKDAVRKCKIWGYEKKLNVNLEYIDCSRKENWSY